MTVPCFVPFTLDREYSPSQVLERAAAFRRQMQSRRSVRNFSDRPVPRPIIEECLLAAGSAPSGANLQPWHFVVVGDPATKHRIREEAEKEEHEFYHTRATPEWLEDLAPLGTDENKPFLDMAPYLIVVFVETYRSLPDGGTRKNYYAHESVGIATGMLITAIHQAGLAVLTHTPSPMGFLNDILRRPKNERPFLVLVVGYPAPDAQVPVLPKKSLAEIATFV